MTNSPDSNGTILQALQGTLAAMFGVQSEKNMRKDVASGDPMIYISIGIIGVLVFVLIIYGIVKSVI